jgi:hypothetical protein
MLAVFMMAGAACAADHAEEGDRSARTVDIEAAMEAVPRASVAARSEPSTPAPARTTNPPPTVSPPVVLTETEVRGALLSAGTVGPMADCVLFLTLTEWGPGTAGLPAGGTLDPVFQRAMTDIFNLCAAQNAAAPPPPVAPDHEDTDAYDDVYYETCEDVWADVGGPVYDGDPGYGDWLDDDGDGEACEIEPGTWEDDWEDEEYTEYEDDWEDEE